MAGPAALMATSSGGAVGHVRHGVGAADFAVRASSFAASRPMAWMVWPALRAGGTSAEPMPPVAPMMMMGLTWCVVRRWRVVGSGPQAVIPAKAGIQLLTSEAGPRPAPG